jgi:hypothetical protein
MGRLIMVVTGAILLVGSGCAIDHSVHSDGLDNASFMNLWNTYAHCKLTSELSDIGTDVHKLADAINSRSENRSFVLPLPTKLERFITRPTNRYAVDMRAMASACSLHAGELALDRGRVDLAQEMFSSVILLYPQDDTSYYIVQAKSYLSALERGVDLSLKTP